MLPTNLLNTDLYSIVSAFDLFEGMTIPCEIFYKQNSDLKLALKNTTLSKISIINLQKLEMSYGSLYVRNCYFEVIDNEIKKEKDRKNLVAFLNIYSNIKTFASKVIDNTLQTKSINKANTDIVSFNIKNTIVTFSDSHILKAVNEKPADYYYLYNHSIHVAMLNGLMGKWLKYSDEQISKLVRIGFLHDIGKTRIPEQILNKPGPLTDYEFQIIKTHPVHSYEMLIECGEKDTEILEAVRGHHEKTNGTGYPDRLPYEKMSEYSRITTISDIYDAMISKRVYKSSNSPFEVLDEFSRGKFSNLDPHLIDVFLQRMPGELIGKRILLSDGRVGTVVFVNPREYLYPIVNIDDNIIKTNEKLRCLSFFD